MRRNVRRFGRTLFVTDSKGTVSVGCGGRIFLTEELAPAPNPENTLTGPRDDRG